MDKEAKDDYANMLDYFWCEKGDLERFTGWNEALTEREFPAVYEAWKNYKRAKAVMNAVIKSLRS